MVPARLAARLAACVALFVALLLALPAVALAADPVTISGTVVRDGAPVANVQVIVSVTGSDQIVDATTDEQGAFAVQVDADAGAEVHIDATGLTSHSDPDSRNCVHFETPTGSLTFTIDSLPPAPVVVPMDDVRGEVVCGPTPTPQLTPPSTDLLPAPAATQAGNGLLLVVGLLSLLGAGLLLVARRWR